LPDTFGELLSSYISALSSFRFNPAPLLANKSAWRAFVARMAKYPAARLSHEILGK
jgi:hypothetical protein